MFWVKPKVHGNEKEKKANDMQLLSFFRGHVTHLLL